MSGASLPAYSDYVSEHNLASERGPAPRRRWPYLLAAATGLVLIVAPIALGMFTRAAQGQLMLSSFAPYMSQEQITSFRNDLTVISAARANVTSLQSTGQAPAGRYQYVDGFVRDYPAIDADLNTTLDAVQANLGNYQRLTALPPFGSIPWLFVLPGAVLLGAGVLGARKALHGTPSPIARGVIGLTGIALIAAPLALGLFADAPAGSQLVDGFTPVLTRDHVRQLQGYFVTLVGGQGELDSRYTKAVRVEHPEADLSAIDALASRWQPMTSEFAGFVGAMSDNVENFDGVVALRDSTRPLGFDAFHGIGWFFVVSGVLALAAAYPGGKK
ncbi:hypothetical protein [Antrihabitans cavernicola]|uniref:Uncharacterized protein n=1 Tax=Antrihabitans cavernicola TaxID=2495913 RepID=A0A5A7SC31_9NOCA|nr:hypothetical protein [Spelaeibacter cavernicola]KAA0022712.1 hypothetical protein FOY51_13620 [Spelaeibacter cavernicola]